VEAAYKALASDGFLTGVGSDDVRVAAGNPERRRELLEGLQLDKLVEQELGRRELEMARDVQRRLLPPPELTGAGWQVAARCQPARLVAGDFYDVLRRSDDSVDLIVADVAGKGFAASLIMASVKAMLPFVATDRDVAETLAELNRRLADELGRGEFVGLTLARYRPADRSVELANAGVPDPYIVRPGRAAVPLAVSGPRLPLGVRSQVNYETCTVELAAGECLLLLSDGLPEARDAEGEPLGYEAIEAMIADQPSAESPTSWLTGLFDTVQQRSGRDPEDDWTAALLVPQETGGAS
jgi:sigma-B regulation protein RsbU (phosphoserine phosphatase)